MDEMNDNSLVEHWDVFIHDGNLDALSRVYFDSYDLLFTYGLKHTVSKPFVEDTIQDVFMNLIKYRKSIGAVRNLSGYLISTFRRQLFLGLNLQKKTIHSEQIPEVEFNFFNNPEQVIAEEENLEQIHVTIKKCIGKLTPKQQEIIFLRFESGVSYEEISEMLQISVDSCYKSVYRSIRTIRAEAEKILRKKEIIVI